MAEFGKRKRPERAKRMSEFKQKSPSLVSKAKSKITTAGRTVKNVINRNVAKVATKEELRDIEKGINKAAKSKTAKKIGRFLEGWARASQKAFEMPRQRDDRVLYRKPKERGLHVKRKK